jgi:hypothetical protein
MMGSRGRLWGAAIDGHEFQGDRHALAETLKIRAGMPKDETRHT